MNSKERVWGSLAAILCVSQVDRWPCCLLGLWWATVGVSLVMNLYYCPNDELTFQTQAAPLSHHQVCRDSPARD
jgi:hypothetical protein